MKKAMALLIAVITVLTAFAGCTKKIYFDEEEFASAVSESESIREESSSKQEEDISEEKENLEEELGKTEKNKKIVLKLEYGEHMEYVVMYFKRGKADYKMTYKYFFDRAYYDRIKGYGDDGTNKLVDSDDNTMCLTYKNKDVEGDYEDYYELWVREDSDVRTVL